MKGQIPSGVGRMPFSPQKDMMTEVMLMKKFVRSLLLCLLLCCVWLGAAAEGALRLGDSGEKVLELNTRLRQLNYTTTRAGEQYTAATQAAVTAVQAAYGLEQTGEADESTLAVIYGECYRPLKYGDSGTDVKLLQDKLYELGYYWGNITGNYLEGSISAIQTFQGEHGLEQTGVADVKTQEALFASSVRPTPSPTPAPSATPLPTPSPTPGPYQAFKRKLQKGDKGEDVQRVQQRLMDLGFFTYHKTTLNFQAQTLDAVKKFQTYNGLTANGAVDEKTWNALFNETDVVPAAATPRPARPAAYFFEVDVNNQVVKVWKYNEDTQAYTDLDRAFLCATGTTKYPSPLGTFTLTGRKARWCEFPKWGGGKAQYWTKIDDEIAFHSVLYSDNDEMTLKVNSLTSLGKRGSHGCIRLTVADAKWIYDRVENGMQVWIHEDGAADPELRYFVQPGALDKAKLRPVTTPEPPVYPEYDAANPLESSRMLSFGSEGAEVYWLQCRLKELGFYQGTCTGQYREGTRNAVKAYQRARGLSADGAAGTKTLKQLYAEVKSVTQ